jgi:HEAT repeat protein
VLRAIQQNAVAEPDLLLLLSECPARAAVGTMMELMGQVGLHGRINIASALGRMIEVDHVEVIRKLLTFREAWVVVYCLRALEARGDPSFLTAVRSIHARTTVETVKVQSVRAAGGLPGQASVVFCLDALRDPSPRVQAQALESLVRLKCPVEVLREEARPLLSSPSLRARVNALLATATCDEDPPVLRELLISAETIDRVEAAYCLGYLQSPRSLQHLNHLVNADPSLTVRLQAVKSLSKYEAQDALELLVPLVSHPEARVALTAARVLSRYEGAAAVLVCRAITTRLATTDRGFERGLLYRALGAVGGKSGCADAEAPLRSGLEEADARALSGAVEGWSLYLGQNSASHGDYLLGALARCDLKSRPRAVMGLIIGGQLEGFQQMTQLLAGPAQALPAVNDAVLELALMLSEAVEESRFPFLSAKLDAVAATLEAPPSTPPPPAKLQATSEASDAPFTVHKMRRRARVEARSDGLKRPPAPAPLVHTTGLGNRLRELTYLVGDSIAEPVFWKKVNSTKYIWAPAVLCMVVGLGTLWALVGRLEAGKVQLPQSPLQVAGFFGRVSYQPTGAPVLARQAVAERSKIAVSDRARLQLLTTKGTTVQLQTPTVSVLRAQSDVRGYEFEVARGYCAVSGNPKGDRTQIDYDRYRISTQHGKFTLENYRGKYSLIVERGPVWFTDGVTSLSELDSGDSRLLE